MGGSGDTNITAALIYAGLAEQNKLLKDVGTQEAHMYIKRIQVYGLHPGFYISMAPTTVPGKAFMPAMQIYDMGIEGSSQANLTHRWPGDITINNPVDVANTNAVCLITADNAAGSDSEWYAFVSVSLHSNLTVPFTELTPAILIAGGAQADVLNQKSRSAFSKKRRTETTLALSIAKIRKLQMPVIDNVQ